MPCGTAIGARSFITSLRTPTELIGYHSAAAYRRRQRGSSEVGTCHGSDVARGERSAAWEVGSEVLQWHVLGQAFEYLCVWTTYQRALQPFWCTISRRRGNLRISSQHLANSFRWMLTENTHVDPTPCRSVDVVAVRDTGLSEVPAVSWQLRLVDHRQPLPAILSGRQDGEWLPTISRDVAPLHDEDDRHALLVDRRSAAGPTGGRVDDNRVECSLSPGGSSALLRSKKGRRLQVLRRRAARNP